MEGPPQDGITRRALIEAGALAAGLGAAGLRPHAARAAAPADAVPPQDRVFAADFTQDPGGEGWGPRWRCTNVANVRRAGGEAVLEGGSDVFPNDPRPGVFLLDARVRDAQVAVTVTRVGAGAGVALRRVSPRDYYAAYYDTERGRLAIVRRSGADLAELAAAPALLVAPPFVLTLEATGTAPTQLRATLGTLVVTATDPTPALQGPGDAAVLGAARTLFPSKGPAGFPALGNIHLLPYGVQEGEAFLQTPVGRGIIGEIRRESTLAIRDVAVLSGERPARTPPAVIAATSGAPVAGGATLHVATDVRARVTLEVGTDPQLRGARRIDAGLTGPYDGLHHTVDGLPPGRRAYWRATAERHGVRQPGPVRSFRVLPAAGDRGAQLTLAIAACASQFGPIFGHLVALRPDLFIWQGDLNYPDTVGPLAQTLSGYAGIWRDFLVNPVLAPLLETTGFVAQRDDHDYAVQDANAAIIPPWGIAPWDGLMSGRRRFRFRTGPIEVWVLDQRREKSDPTAPDTPAKTLLGPVQRRWLLRSLATSDAPVKVICSPCTVFMRFNARDGNWSAGFTAERDLLLAHIRDHVSGRVVFVTGDTHLTGVYDHADQLEVRACPLDIPTPNDVTLVDPNAAAALRKKPGVTYASDLGHFAVVRVDGEQVELSMVREDGATPWRQVVA